MIMYRVSKINLLNSNEPTTYWNGKIGYNSHWGDESLAGMHTFLPKLKSKIKTLSNKYLNLQLNYPLVYSNYPHPFANARIEVIEVNVIGEEAIIL